MHIIPIVSLFFIIHPSTGRHTYVVSVFWLLWINAAINVQEYRYLFKILISFLLDVYPEAGLLQYGSLAERHFNEFSMAVMSGCTACLNKSWNNFGCVIWFILPVLTIHLYIEVKTDFLRKILSLLRHISLSLAGPAFLIVWFGPPLPLRQLLYDSYCCSQAQAPCTYSQVLWAEMSPDSFSLQNCLKW